MTDARAARQAAGFTLGEAARRAGISTGYLRRCERVGTSYLLARRLAALYQCPLDLFLPNSTGKEGLSDTSEPVGGGRSRRRARHTEQVCLSNEADQHEVG